MPATKRARRGPTPVYLRRWHDDGTVFAVLPKLRWAKGEVTAYAHVGQHSGADLELCLSLSDFAEVGESDTDELVSELRGLGYELEILAHLPCRTRGCKGDPDDGEGWDGWCGNCADRRSRRCG